MIRHKRLESRFVTEVPRELDAGVLYVSMEYATALHRCCCGCGEEVVTPLTPTDWKLTFDGVAVSLWPSVGNWNLACRSHYVIRDNRVLESGAWTPQMIDAEIRRDRAAKAKYYGADADQPPEAAPAPTASMQSVQDSRIQGFIARIIRWISG